MIPRQIILELKKKKLKKSKAQLPPLNLERQYALGLRPLIQLISDEVKQWVIAKLPAWSESFYSQRPDQARLDAIDDDIITALEFMNGQINRKYTPAELKRLAAKTGESVSEWNQRAIKENLKRVMGVDIFFEQPFLVNELSMFTVNNTLLISSLKDKALSDVQKMVWDGFRSGTRWEEMAKDITDYVDPEVGNIAKRANLIARDQVNKLNGQLTFLRQSELGITKYVWRTMQDERVRDSHRAKDGNEYSWDSPPADTGHPGEDYNCRCYAEPVLSTLIESLDTEE